MEIEIGDLITVNPYALGSSGEAIGDSDGFKIFIDGALPNEEVSVRITTVKKNYARGNVERIIISSPDRVKPPCPYYDRCGGCQLMHLSYQGQLSVKRQKVIDALQRIGGQSNAAVSPCMPSPDALHYRNKIQLPIVPGPQGTKIGLYARNTHEVVAVDRCMIHCILGEEVYSQVQQMLKESGIAPYDEKTGQGTLRHLLIKSAIGTGEVLIILITTGKENRKVQEVCDAIMEICPSVKGVVENINKRSDNVIMGKTFITRAGQGHIIEKLSGLYFKMSPPSFFQVNPLQADHLYAKAIQLAELNEGKSVLDAFCGVGTLALIASESAADVHGIETVAEAIEDAKENARMNGITNCSFTCGKAEKLVPKMKSFDVTLLNPPRKGCDPALLNCLASKTLIYVSCDPATLARDIAILIARGYELDGVFPFDMFPQTMHVETVVRLRAVTQQRPR
ncbi:MAG: 23S rRNA (uracil(1939)-C(5))-methyltransferase RlmD [Chlamydiales bacterium]|nr:23S rRNA (uracil(1939)-C(5))-methyltransferase RlmD [Chlamydiia bacterium]MCP5508276.1 23S rRNA (uracil(1939)-C(5))-methyltransferase RlmD [Chlamydiales bacterium]